MNVLIAADMEGVVGIDDYGECLPSHPAGYARGRKLMTEEVLVAVEALQAGGAGRISVGDWHMVGTNIERERMPAGVEVRPIADLALVEAEPSMTKANSGPLDAVVFIGTSRQYLQPAGFLLTHLHLGDGGAARWRVVERGPGLRAGARRRPRGSGASAASWRRR